MHDPHDLGREIADELYARFIYDRPPLTHMVSLQGMYERCVTVLDGAEIEARVASRRVA